MYPFAITTNAASIFFAVWIIKNSYIVYESTSSTPTPRLLDVSLKA